MVMCDFVSASVSASKNSQLYSCKQKAVGFLLYVHIFNLHTSTYQGHGTLFILKGAKNEALQKWYAER